MNMATSEARAKGIIRLVRPGPPTYVGLTCAMIATAIIADKACADGTLGFVPQLDIVCWEEQHGDDPPPTIAGFLLDQDEPGGEFTVFYFINLEGCGSEDINSANLYLREGDSGCDTDDLELLETLCTGTECENPLEGQYTLPDQQQEPMLYGHHVIVLETSDGQIWIRIVFVKDPPLLHTAWCNPLHPCTDPFLTGGGGLLLHYFNSGEVDYDITIGCSNPPDDWQKASANVYVDADNERCTDRGRKVLNKSLSGTVIAGCGYRLHGTYILTDKLDRVDMTNNEHTIIITWPGQNPPQEQDIWIPIHAHPYLSVPTLSTWGVVVMSLLLLTSGKIYFMRRRGMTRSCLFAQ